MGQGARLALAWFRQKAESGELRTVDLSFVLQALSAPALLPVVLGPTFFERMAALGVRPVMDNVEGYVDFLLSGASVAV